jgi:hypothetical protein
VNAYFKATPSQAYGAVSVFPQLFVAGSAGDQMNVGSGALESGTNDEIDSYYSASMVITPTADETLTANAFGYDSDRGASSYDLDYVQITATLIGN